MITWLVLCFLASALLGSVLTDAVRRYALARAVLDAPNARSLHSVPMPRGGGLAVVAVVLLAQGAMILLGLLDRLPGSMWWLGAALLAALGWADDRRPLGSGLRLAVQFVVAIATVLALHAGAGWPVASMLAVIVATTVACVWAVNLYNFMDGSDGIAGVQALAAGAAGAALAWLAGQPGLAFVAAALAGAALGFLRWNWQPARIFMGDAGSCFLGFQFALLGLYSAATGAPFLYWAILLAPFVTDATLTLLRRLIRGERWLEAHRSHAYQLLIRGGASHARVALGFGAFCVVLLWPLAYASVRWPPAAPAATLTAYVLAATIWAVSVTRARELL